MCFLHFFFKIVYSLSILVILLFLHLNCNRASQLFSRLMNFSLSPNRPFSYWYSPLSALIHLNFPTNSKFVIQYIDRSIPSQYSLSAHANTVNGISVNFYNSMLYSASRLLFSFDLFSLILLTPSLYME